MVLVKMQTATVLISLATVLGALGTVSGTSLQAAAQTTSIRMEDAEQQLIKKVPPVYPPLAKAARLQGTVKIEALISTRGSITSLKVLEGHPLLVGAALDAVKQWEYKPFVVDGQAVEVRTVVEVPFSLGISEAEYRAEKERADKYFKREDECRELLESQRYPEAEEACKSAVELAEKLPKERKNERRTAYGSWGGALVLQRKFREALQVYLQELQIAEASLKPYEAELGYAYHHVALAYHGAGDLVQARAYYQHAETTLREAREHIDSDFLKNEYTKTIKKVLENHLLLLRQTGQEEAAAGVQQRLEAVSGKIRPAGPAR